MAEVTHDDCRQSRMPQINHYVQSDRMDFALLCSDNHHTHLYSHRIIASALGHFAEPKVDSGREDLPR